MSRTFFTSIFLIILSSVTTAQDQIDPLVMRRTLGRELRAAAEQRYPNAKVTWCDLDTSRGVKLRLDLRDIAPSDIVAAITCADTANIERLSRAILSDLSRLHGVDESTLTLTAWLTRPVHKGGASIIAEFRQCFDGTAVYLASARVSITAMEMRLDIHNCLRGRPQVVEQPIVLDSAVSAIESSERIRFQSGEAPRRTLQYGANSKVAFEDYYDIRDSTGVVIPFVRRLVGAEIVVYADSGLLQAIPTFAWRVTLGSGSGLEQLPYFEAFVDARTGRVMDAASISGGCRITPWKSYRCGP